MTCCQKPTMIVKDVPAVPYNLTQFWEIESSMSLLVLLIHMQLV